MTGIEKIIRPIVEGQIRGFIKEHPVIVEAVDWFKPRDDKSVTFINSLAKRIVRDLTCPTVRARLATALLEPATGTQSNFGCGTFPAAKAASLELATELAASPDLCPKCHADARIISTCSMCTRFPSPLTGRDA